MLRKEQLVVEHSRVANQSDMAEGGGANQQRSRALCAVTAAAQAFGPCHHIDYQHHHHWRDLMMINDDQDT